MKKTKIYLIKNGMHNTIGTTRLASETVLSFTLVEGAFTTLDTYTRRDATRNEGWQPSRVVAYVKLSALNRPTAQQQFCPSGVQQPLVKFATG